MTVKRHECHDLSMTTERQERIPALTLGWRLKMSLGEMSRDEIARIMDVTPSTISRWMADKGAPPKRPYLIQWALATGTPVEWLATGEAVVSNGGPNDGGGLPAGKSQTLLAVAA